MAKGVREKNRSVFVLMPYGSHHEYEGGIDEAEYVFNEIIRPGVRSALSTETQEPKIFREIDRMRSGSITDSLVRALVEADIVIVDITGRNPNVFLELGIRYALRNKVTILISQSGSLIPFDIAGYRHIEYHRFRPREAVTRIAEFIKEGLGEHIQSDSVVFDVFKNLSVVIPGCSKAMGASLLVWRASSSGMTTLNALNE